MQRKEEEGLRKEADRLNGLMSETDAKNWVHKVVGRRGERRLVRVRVEEEGEGGRQQRRGRRNRSLKNGIRILYTNAQSIVNS